MKKKKSCLKSIFYELFLRAEAGLEWVDLDWKYYLTKFGLGYGNPTKIVLGFSQD